MPPLKGEGALSAVPVGVTAAALVTRSRDTQVVSARGGKLVNLLGAHARGAGKAPRTVGGAPLLPPPKGGRARFDVPVRVTAAALGAPRGIRISEMQPKGRHLGAGARSPGEAPRGVGWVHPLPPPEGDRVLPDVPVGVTAAGTGGGRYALLRGPPVSWAPGTVDATGDEDTRDDWYEVRVAKPRAAGVDSEAGTPRRLEAAGL